MFFEILVENPEEGEKSDATSDFVMIFQSKFFFKKSTRGCRGQKFFFAILKILIFSVSTAVLMVSTSCWYSVTVRR